jgi:hypothetical protein
VGKIELSGTKTAEDAPELISLPPRASLAPGDLIGGRYEIRGRVGAGGMGAIYRVRDRQLHEDIALKMVLPAHRNRVNYSVGYHRPGRGRARRWSSALRARRGAAAARSGTGSRRG